MGLTPIGHVFLDGLQFTSDPSDLAIERPARRTYMPTIGGGLYQDFGQIGSDARIRLSSGQSQLMSAALKAQIEARAAVKGATYSYSDWTGLSATVLILSFRPKPTFIPDGASGSVFYTYELELGVVS
jgi:hypothetical protein